MFTGKRLVVICDLTSSTSSETGDKIKSVINGRKVICNKDLVGLQTQMYAQSQNMIFDYSLEIDRMYYANQKYVYLDDNLYEIKGINKGSKPNLCKLNVSILDDSNIKSVIEGWLNGIQ